MNNLREKVIGPVNEHSISFVAKVYQAYKNTHIIWKALPFLSGPIFTPFIHIIPIGQAEKLVLLAILSLIIGLFAFDIFKGRNFIPIALTHLLYSVFISTIFLNNKDFLMMLISF